jgi:hypothetical protein
MSKLIVSKRIFSLQLLHTAIIGTFVYVVIHAGVLPDGLPSFAVIVVFSVILAAYTSNKVSLNRKKESEASEKALSDLAAFLNAVKAGLDSNAIQMEQKAVLMSEYIEKINELSAVFAPATAAEQEQNADSSCAVTVQRDESEERPENLPSESDYNN